ncbi:MAG: MFS transporter [Sciscionella sp.]
MTTTSNATPAGAVRPGPPHAAAPATTEGPDPRRWWGLVVIALAQLMVVLDMTVINIALPHTQADLHISIANRQWVITAYTLAFGGLLLLGGRVSDLIGRKRAFLIGLVGFGIASVAGGAAANAGMLFTARAVQGVFAAVLAPAALSLLTTTFTDPKERSKAFGVFGALAGSGSAIGLIAGGLLTEYLSWRWTMFVNVPIAVLAVIGAVFLLHTPPSRPVRHKLDIPGVILGCGGLLALVYGFTEAEPRGWDDPLVLSLLIGAGVLLIAFVLVERRSPQPLLPLHVVADRNRAGAFLAVALVIIGMFGLFLFLTYFLQVNLGYSPVRTGLAFLPMTAAIIIGSTQIAARLLPHVAPRLLMVPGAVLAAGGMALLTGLTVDSGYASTVLPAELLLGLGFGLVVMPAVSTATSGVAAKDAGITSATVNTAQQVGGSVGTALLNTIAVSATATYLTAHGRNPLQLAMGAVHGYTVAIWWAVGVLVLAGIISGVLINVSPRKAAERAADTGPAGSGQDTARLAVRQPDREAEAGRAAVHGTVTGADAAPVPGAAITLIDGAGRQVAQTVSGHGGQYRLPLPAPGRYVLITAAEAHQPEAAPITVTGAPFEFNVALTAACTLSGTVHDTEGTPVAGALAVLADSRGEVLRRSTTGEDGAYELNPTTPGDYTLAVSHPHHQPTATAVTVTSGRPTTYDVTLVAHSTVSGTIRNRTGAPVTQARVTLVDDSGTLVTSTTTGADGSYHFDGVRPGDYTVIASGYAPAARPFVINAAEAHWQEVELSHAE